MKEKFPIRSYEEWRKYTDLVSAVEKRRINVGDVFVQIPQKRKILREVLRYEFLRGAGRVMVPIIKCKAERIGRAFQNQYNLANKKLREQRLLEFEISCEEADTRKAYQGSLFS